MSDNEKEIINQKVKRVMVIVELENGKSVIANYTGLGGDINELVTLKDLQGQLSNKDGSEDVKFMSPFVFTLDLRSAAREWVNKWRNEIKEIEQRNKEWESEDILADRPACAIPDFSEEIQTYLGSIAAFKHFFNLEEK